MSRPGLRGGVPRSWEAQKPLVSRPGPHRHTVKVFPLPFLLLPPGKMAFVPGDTLSQLEGGGRGKGTSGKQGRCVWGREGGESHSRCTSLLLQPLP